MEYSQNMKNFLDLQKKGWNPVKKFNWHKKIQK